MRITTESFSSKVNKRILSMELRLQDDDGLLRIGRSGVKEITPVLQRSFIDDKIERYQKSLEEALRNAPCAGCRRLVLSCLTGHAIFQAMTASGKNRDEISDADIEHIKREVEQKYASF